MAVIEIGKRYQRLVIVSECESIRDNKNKRIQIVLARCDCGTQKSFRLKNLKTGNTKSCGCLDAEKMAERNALSSQPQSWTVSGDVAWITLKRKRALVDAADVEIVAKYRWYMDNSGYIDSMQCDPMHRLLLGLKKGDPRETDHKDHCPWDNRRSQIRIATSGQNKMNRRGNVDRVCHYKGVSRSRGKFRAQLCVNGERIWIGRFPTELDAAKAYDEAAKRHFGDFACLNFPDEPETS